MHKVSCWWMFCAAVRLEIELAKEEESLSHTLHNVPVVSKKHLFPQEISLSMPTARAADSSGNLFFFPQTNWLSALAISAYANLRHGNSDILARIVQYAFPYECPQKTLVAQDDTSMLTLCSLTWSKLEYRALFLLSSQFWLWLVTIVFSIFSKRKKTGFSRVRSQVSDSRFTLIC